MRNLEDALVGLGDRWREVNKDDTDWRDAPYNLGRLIFTSVNAGDMEDKEGEVNV
jgi:hypothetical protein